MNRGFGFIVRLWRRFIGRRYYGVLLYRRGVGAEGIGLCERLFLKKSDVKKFRRELEGNRTFGFYGAVRFRVRGGIEF